MGERKNVKYQDGKVGTVLEELRVPTQVKLAGLWGGGDVHVHLRGHHRILQTGDDRGYSGGKGLDL